MTSSLPLLLTASLLGGVVSAPLLGATTAAYGPPAPAGSADRGVAAGAPGDVVEHAARRADPGYWTPERMARALPVDLLDGAVGALLPRSAEPQRAAAAPSAVGGSRWLGDGQVARTTGRVFLTMDRTDFVCSASTVRSANRDLVVTAGHCVKNGTGSWADNWLFVPGYSSGRGPYGSFTARRMFVAAPWSKRGDDSFDVAMVALNTSDGRHVADVVGAQQIAFNPVRGGQTYGFGFPADPPYGGDHLVYCSGQVRPDPHRQTTDQGLRCDMTAGSSGGPWLSAFDPATGAGTITSVSSFKYSDDLGTMYGPYFGEEIRELYGRAQHS
ncbi:trypsin-like serine peptidase [Rhizohabitans arisaemae]|uniref:trypsin-like serine peptidase n=1 Tax=Rhizohabitans arisaemae TaxID=2720610 RepID=UPI0024B228B9|nr:trypsin-like peptidase domain-containing protein [Rhizohabitans arisaemae]